MTNRSMKEILPGQKLLTLPAEASVRQACEQMHSRRVGTVLITDAEGQLLGIFTDHDCVRCVAMALEPGATQLREVMTPNPETVPSSTTALEALRLMRDCGFRHIPVVECGIPIGVVSAGDFRGLEHDLLDAETTIWERR